MNQFSRVRQLCESCKNYAGGCPWTALDEKGRVKFEPVPGWTAEKVPFVGGKQTKEFTYRIIDCPLYVDDGSGTQVKNQEEEHAQM